MGVFFGLLKIQIFFLKFLKFLIFFFFFFFFFLGGGDSRYWARAYV